MPNLIGSTIARNFEKATATTILGTRELKFYSVESGNVNFATNYTNPGSAYAKAIIALQQYIELYAVLTPGSAGFIIVVAVDTANGAEPNSNVQATTFGAAEAAVKDASASSSITITELATTTGNGITIAA
jgi:hypothetical protein